MSELVFELTRVPEVLIEPPRAQELYHQPSGEPKTARELGFEEGQTVVYVSGPSVREGIVEHLDHPSLLHIRCESGCYWAAPSRCWRVPEELKVGAADADVRP